MATTDLKLEEPGTFSRPGPIGRLARLSMGVACMFLVTDLVATTGNLMTDDSHIKPLIWNGSIFGVFLVSYIINIGYSRSWKKWPAIVSVAVFLLVAAIGYVNNNGTFETPLLAGMIWAWTLYLFLHLGTAFVLAALIGTPGCEMRAFHDLFSRATGITTKEHYCPVGPLNPLDQWEQSRSWMS